ncbi:uridine kinase family protein [Micropruina sp.]|uniref:uridine kinase family protein n=1 Tax=Micropruina sp. TaxID=2737536 RepID=UPI0039E6AD07
MMQLPDGTSEPPIDAWHDVTVTSLLARLGVLRGDRPVLVAVDGRSGAGKSTLARRLADAVPDAAVVATDDIAWNLSMFDWARELATNVLIPVRRGQSVRYRPPGWITHDRPGAVVVPAARSLLIVEGVGSSQAALAHLLDAALWVQSDAAVARRLGLARDIASGANGDEPASVAFWDEWGAAERVFLEREEPWLRASAIVAGVPLATDQDLLCAISPHRAPVGT